MDDVRLESNDSKDQQLGILLAEAQEALDYGHNEEAVELYEEAISHSDSPDAELFNKLGIAHARLERLTRAEQAFEEALKIDSKFVPAISNLGNIYFSRHDLEAAEEYYKQATSYDPEYATAYNNLAALYKKQGKIGESVQALKKSQRLALKNPPRSYHSAGADGTQPRRRGLLGCFGSSLLLLVIVALLIVLGATLF